jgi:5-methylcytosine-specific restriction endonuclease McrA
MSLLSEVDRYNHRESRLKVFERNDYLCRYCNKQLTQTSATPDHVIPISSGGGNALGNLRTACLGCNSRKFKRPLVDFLATHQQTYLPNL